jgi:hypothetical protein
VVRRFLPDCVLARANSGGGQIAPRSLDLLLIVPDRPSADIRWKITGSEFDLHLVNATVVRANNGADMSRAAFQTLVSGTVVYGDRGLADDLRSSVQSLNNPKKRRNDSKAMRPKRQALTALRANLLATRMSLSESIRDGQSGLAALSAVHVLSTSVALFAMTNGLDFTDSREIIEALQAANGEAASLLDNVLRASSGSPTEKYENVLRLAGHLTRDAMFDWVAD